MTLKSYAFDHSAFSLMNPLPMTLPAGSKSTLTAAIRTDSSRLYQSTCQLTYEVEGQTKTSSGQISAGLFRDDDSERAYTGHRALDAYNASKIKDPNSVATQNNLGVLYRLLREPVIAEQNFFSAVSKALNAKYGYSGIKMNIGVTKSDRGQASGANEYYNYALGEVSANASTSSLAPQLYYNKAWEAYAGDNLSETTTQANRTIVHNKANNCLKAKAYVLRGAVYFRQGYASSAQSDFRQAISLSTDCPPIRRMAEENLQISKITSADERDEENLPRVLVLMPNYPNPFNPETTISFGLPKNGKVELLIYNFLGQKIRTLFEGQMPAGWHNVTWDGADDSGNQVGSGVYLLQMKTEGFNSVQKMTLLR
jgi:tetratricopeptide (TPR) repeat protein